MLDYHKQPFPNLETFDHTRLTAIATCPTYGAIRYGLHKTVYDPDSLNKRNMALYAGEKCHEIFAFVRFLELLVGYGKDYDLYHDNIRPKMEQRLPKSLYELLCKSLSTGQVSNLTKSDNITDDLVRLVVHAFDLLDYEDDIKDTKRTAANVQGSLINYAKRYPFGKRPIYVTEDFLGVEVPFHIGVSYKGMPLCNLSGRMDGLHWYSEARKRLCVQENKTGSRINAMWQTQQDMSYQHVCYGIAISTLIDQRVDVSQAIGLRIPPPTARYGQDDDGYREVLVNIDQASIENFERWLLHNIQQQKDLTPGHAATLVQNRHSCDRFFSLCEFHDLCRLPTEDRISSIKEDLFVNQWSPLDKKKEVVGE